MQYNLLTNKKGLIMGVANEKSIAWSIAKVAAENGAKICLTFPNSAVEKRIRPLADQIGAQIVYCDVLDESSIENLTSFYKNDDGVDFLVHSIAFAPKEVFSNKYYAISKADFLTTIDVSCRSLTAVCYALRDVFNPDASIVTMSYHGANIAAAGYNIMGVAKAALESSVRYLACDMKNGIRVNSISAGPIKTIAANAIPNFNIMYEKAQNAPLKRNVTQDDVARAAIFLLSDLSSGVTGSNLYVDCGLHIIG